MSCVGNAMTAALRPRNPWWENLLAMAGSLDPSTSPPTRPTPDRSSDPAPSRPDADLLAMDPAEALAELTRRHADAVYRVALSVSRSHEMAEDVAQDALLKAWQALPSFRGDAPLKNWLLRITHNTAISALRRRRDVHVDPADLPEHPGPPHTSVEARVEASISIDAFGTALRELDDLSRSVVVLREVEGLSYEEISQVLDVPLPTVKTRLLRARRVLAASLEGWQP
ncbi:MAG: RNA polymerase sigma factor [Acidimicrobiales bacterium]